MKNSIPFSPQYSGEEFKIFEKEYGKQLEELNEKLNSKKITNITLEGGHIYANETPNESHYTQARLISLLHGHLVKSGRNVKNMLLVDDYNGKPVSLDVDAYILKCHKQGWLIDEVYYESDMVSMADVVLETLEKIGKLVKEKNGFTMERAGGIHLLQSATGKYSCALLDAAFSLIKFKQPRAQYIINVLPKKYKFQQARVKKILRTLLETDDLPFYNFFI